MAHSHHSLNNLSKAFLFFVTILAFTIIGFTVYNLFESKQSEEDAKIFSESSVLIISTIALTYFAFDATFNENYFQLIAFFVLSIVLTSRIVVEFIVYTDTSKQIVYLIALIFCCTLEIILVILGMFVYKSFGYLHYHYSALPFEQGLFKRLQKFFSLLKLDFVFSLLWIAISFQISSYTQIIVASSVGFVSLIFYYTGYFGSLYESTKAMNAFFILSGISPAYIVYLSYYLIDLTSMTLNNAFDMISVICACVGCRIALVFVAKSVLTNFGLGLRERLLDKNEVVN